MTLAVCSNEGLRKELLAQDLNRDSRVEWVDKPEDFKSHGNADAFIDLLFEPSVTRLNLLKKLQPATVIVNSVITPLAQLPEGFIRINGWNTFLKRAVVEASGIQVDAKEKAVGIFSIVLHKIPGHFFCCTRCLP